MINQAIFCAVAVAQFADVQVLRWQPCDFSFQSRSLHENPFMVQFSALVKGPNDIEFSIPGFYDGDKTWKIRVSPTTEGEWSILTRSDDPELDGKGVSFTCIPNDNPEVHGGLLVDRDNPYHFVFEDGTRYFMMGYECDWLWALDMNDPALPTLNPFLDKLKANGFNLVILNAYAHDTPWLKGNTSDHDLGPPPMYAWEGSNENPVHSRFNLAYWKHYDRVISALYQRGIIAHIMIKVYNKMVNWPKKGSIEDDLYFRWLIARYSAYPNVIWDFSKEANNEPDLEYKLDRFSFIRRHDPYHRLITNHDDKATYDRRVYNEVLDFRSDQQHSNWHEKLLSQRKQNIWPVVNVEFGYEHGPNGPEDKTYGVVQSPEEVCRRAWEICLAGGYSVYYYTYTAWDVIRPKDSPPGYSYFRQLRRFFEETRYWLMKPSDDLVSEGYCLADPGKEYIVFLNKAEPFTIVLGEGTFKARWFNPFTGEYISAGVFAGGAKVLSPPSDWPQSPIALHITLAEAY